MIENITSSAYVSHSLSRVNTMSIVASRAGLASSFYGIKLPGWAVFIIGLMLVLPLTVLIPPFQVPDEMQHFYRAYEIGEPHIVGFVQGKTAGADLPSSLSEMTAHFLGTKSFVSPPVIQRSLKDVLSYADVPLSPERTEYTIYTNQIIYSPLAYIPQTIGIAIGRLIGSGTLLLLYFGRIANAFFAVLFVSIGITKLKSGQIMLGAAALLPMTIYEFASVSADAQVISSAFLFTALSLRGLSNERWTISELILALISGLIFCTAKFAYFPILFIAIPALFKNYRKADVVTFTLVIPFVVIVCTAGWLHHVSSMVLISNPSLQQNNAAEQFAFIRAHPLSMIAVGTNTVAHSIVYVRGLIGILGWLSLPLPVIGYVLGLTALLSSMLACREYGKIPTRLSALFYLLIAATSCALVALALYLTWTPPGRTMVDGLQGRYATPVLFVTLVALQALLAYGVPPRIRKAAAMICVVATLANVALCYGVVIVQFGLFR